MLKFFRKRNDGEHTLFLGRFQPFHRGHEMIVEQMQNPVIAIVKGKKSDPEKNPFPFGYQKSMIRKVFPRVPVIQAKQGYVPDIITQYYEDTGVMITRVVCGEDRFADYTRQIRTSEYQGNIAVELAPRFHSASQIRQYIIEGDMERFYRYMPAKLHGQWLGMRNFILPQLEG